MRQWRPRAAARGLFLALFVARVSAGDPVAVSSLLSVPDVPYLAQPPALCGGAAVAMVLRYWGDPDAAPEDFAPALTVERDGIDTDRLPLMARREGFDALVFAARPLEAIVHLEKGRPLVVLLQVAPERYHYVVALAWRNQKVLYHDPAAGPFRVMPEKEWMDRWTAAGNWTLLLLPPSGALVRAERDPGEETVSSSDEPCASLIQPAVEHARLGRLDDAFSELEQAAAACPDSGAPFREMAGVEFRRGRWNAAGDRASAAIERDPHDVLARRILASSRFLAGEEKNALAAWNALDEPAVALIRVDGLTTLPFATVQRYLGEGVGGLLTPARLERAERRLSLLPGFQSTRVGYRPLRDGRADLDAAVLERPAMPSPTRMLVDAAVRGASERALGVDGAGLMPRGDAVSASVHWRPERAKAELQVASVRALGLPGLVTLGALWDEQTYRYSASVSRERRRRLSLSLDQWWTAGFRGSVGAAVDQWDDRGRHLSLAVGLERRLLADHLALRADVGGWWAHRRPSFFTTSLQASARTGSVERSKTVVRGELFHDTATRSSPLALWPGAGTGSGRERLLRAHPLIDGGVVTGVLGRRLVGGVLEVERRVAEVGPWRFGAVAFTDGVRVASAAGGAAPEAVAIDVGAGMRMRLPGRRSILRIDAAVPWRGSGIRLSTGWQRAWS